uniref:2-hydroxyacid dehydrogenase n=2 Tax=Tetraselmis sp. GSL018 TaxID=582737 RepID=A0A061R4P0_9CHLO
MANLTKAARALCRAAVLNEGKLNFDNKLDFASLASVAEITRFQDTSPEQVAERALDQDILITKEMTVSGPVIDSLPASVRLICEAGTGFNNIDVFAAERRGITVCNVPSYSTQAVAQLVVTFMLNLSCSLVQQQKKLVEGDVAGWRSLQDLPHFELSGKTLGLVGGRGSIGAAVADIAIALGMNVLISSRSPEPTSNPLVKVVDLDRLLQESDFVSIHCPLNDNTRYMIGSEQLKKMKNAAYLINTARGAIINEEELCVALRNGTVAGAALDVQEVEPLPSDSPLLSLPNVILTPHIGWQRVETRQRLINTVAQNCRQFLDGNPVNVVTT